MGFDCFMLNNLERSNTIHDSASSDLAQINNSILNYGFYVDRCDYNAVADLWLENGEYIVNGVGHWVGHAQIKEMVGSKLHQEYVANGCVHFMGSPSIVLDNNDAYAKSNTLLIKCTSEGFLIDRVSDNSWHFRKTTSGWKILRRENFLLSPKINN